MQGYFVSGSEWCACFTARNCSVRRFPVSPTRSDFLHSRLYATYSHLLLLHFSITLSQLINVLYFAVKSIGHLGQTSKAFRDILIQWMDTKRMQSRLVQRMSTAKIPAMALCSTTLFPLELHNEVIKLGL